MYKKEAAGRKPDEIYSGPFLITKCCSASVYEIQGKKTKFVVHYDRLKKYESETVPKWIVKLKEQIKINHNVILLTM